MREEWVSARGSRGESLFCYQPATKVWKQVWVTDGARGRGGVRKKTLVATLADGSVRFQEEIPLAEGVPTSIARCSSRFPKGESDS